MLTTKNYLWNVVNVSIGRVNAKDKEEIHPRRLSGCPTFSNNNYFIIATIIKSNVATNSLFLNRLANFTFFISYISAI